VNHIVCHFAPSKEDPKGQEQLKNEDVVKVELGCQIDGFPAMLGYTFVVGASKDKPVTGKKADAILAAFNGAEASIRLCKPGKYNVDITETVQKISVDEFKVIPVEGLLSSELKRFVLDGDKQIVFNPTEAQRKDCPKQEFAVGEVYSIDIVVSTSQTGKSHPANIKTNIYKKNSDVTYSLKLQSSRKFYSEVTQKFGCMPFNIRHTSDEKKSRIGVVECVKHGLFVPYDVLEEKPGDFVAQYLVTVLILEGGKIKKLTSFPGDPHTFCKSEHEVKDETIMSLLKEQI
jgi:curved DNA binding protein